MSLKWTRKAAADLDAIYDHYVVLIGPEKALKAVQDIVEQVKPLQQVANQGAGRPSEVPGVRTLTLERWPFSAPFRVKGKEIQILRIDRVEITPESGHTVTRCFKTNIYLDLYVVTYFGQDIHNSQKMDIFRPDQ